MAEIHNKVRVHRIGANIDIYRREPPPCIQNAMLTKDKKPFTYTPGGIDLSEIRSPRMARRLERNALNEGVSSVPQTQHHSSGSLPPSALAAMQPQLSVQVFPTGGLPQVPQGGPPPPPPPPKAPPMKISPVPTDCYNRPDMTKIIPDNPMTLLRKTSGPIVKQDPILNKCGIKPSNEEGVENLSTRPPQNETFIQSNYAKPTEAQVRRQASLDAQSPKSTAGVGSIYIPPINQNNKGESSPTLTYTPPAHYKRQPSTPQVEKPQSPDTVSSPKPTLSKAPTPWLTQRRQSSQEVPEWAINDSRVQSPPVVDEQMLPQTKPVRPWQQQQQQQPATQQYYQQPEMQQQPRYQQPYEPEIQNRYQPQPQREVQVRHQQPQQKMDLSQRNQQPQQFWPEQPEQYTPPASGVRKQIQNREIPQQYNPVERTEVVVINEPPQVYQHPGQRVVTRQSPQNSYSQIQNDGVRVIPVQIESKSNGQVRSPHQGANSDARSLNRQLSWNSTPTQSNTFRVLQKITQTDGSDDENQIAIEHSPRTYQQFPQRQTSMDSGRKWNQNDSDQSLMSTFKQGFDEGFGLHGDVDPRYRGPNIPSKAFKLLQNMTGGGAEPSTTSCSVPQGQPSNMSGPKIRTIPIQIEGTGSNKYVPPSEQTVQEPKKYMGSSIPSRSFKILQAMTAPDECVNPDQACENNENYSNDPSSYTQWGYDPSHPPPSYYFDPYWSYYAQQCYPSNCDAQMDSNQSNPRMTPVPSPWCFYPPYYIQKDKNNSDTKRNQRVTPPPWQSEDSKTNVMRTPTPSWPYCTNYPNENDSNKETQKSEDDQKNYMPYPPCWNPYYYNYYYGVPPPPVYPPIYSPYPFYPQQSDNEEVSGYSSNEEMAYYGARFASMPSFDNTNFRSKNVAEQSERKTGKKDQTATPKVEPKNQLMSDDGETSDSDAEMVSYEVCRNTPGLQTIRSVSDVHVYDAEESSQCSDDSDNTETEENDDSRSLCASEDVIPHQLSVIFEESEKTESARLDRESSVSTTVSEGTATIENSEEEEEYAEESDNTVFVKLPLTFKFVVAERQKVATITVGNSEIVPQVAVRSSIEDSCDKMNKTDELFNKTYIQHSKNTKQNHTDDWLGKISKDDDVPDDVFEKEDEDVQVNALKNSASGIDFWADLRKDASTTQIYPRIKKLTCDVTLIECAEETKDRRSSTSSSSEEKSEIDFWAEIIKSNSGENVPQSVEDGSSACSSNSNLSSSAPSNSIEVSNGTELHTVCSEATLKKEENQEVEEEEIAKPLTIQERIKSLQDCVSSKKIQEQQETDVKISVRERITALQDNYGQLNSDATSNKYSCSRKSSVKSYEDCSEEEADSGVTSDVSRHISEVETDIDFFENKNMNQYQRASTHSRLFKLLQDECDNEEEEEEEEEDKRSQNQNKNMTQRRDCLSLPLKQPGSDPESFSSSGFTSPGSPTINDKIVNELIQSLIMKKRGRIFNNMTMEKLQAAALRILQEDMDGLETLSSSEENGNLSRRGEVINSTPQECYGNFNDYSQYYDSWGNAEMLYDGYNVLPSKAFKLLQEHSSTNKTGSMGGLLAKCPRVLSNKNVQKELIKLIESQETPSPSPDSPEQSRNVHEATSAS
ncbi:hypothetical protein FQA39_LY17333 [Lamprigera yunnana]|nr:hypothetical protein FQA39_LY17333 [Lamprigera yunnana]